jgi:hypothetical protein
LELAVALEVTFALVLAQDPRFVHARLEATQELIEALAFARFDVHLGAPSSAAGATAAAVAAAAAAAALLEAG